MRLYILKYNMLYYMCDCPKSLEIPTNDFRAIELYENHRWLYNKKIIAKSQNIEYGDSNKIPSKYPIIVRPIVNLYGMGKDAFFVDNSKDFKIPTDFFWAEVLKGKHISVDIFFNNNTIQDYIAFEGLPDKLFTFDHWEYLPDYKLPTNIVKWTNKYLKKYNGVFNIEILDKRIIECHLRMGDLNYFQNEELINCVIKCHQNKEFKLPKLNKIYLLPVFVDKGKYVKLKDEDIYRYVRDTNTEDIVLNYFIDPPPDKNSNPNGGDRICNFTITNLEKGYYLRDYILKIIQ